MAENKGPSTKKKKRGGSQGPGHGFKPGQSGNPGGRPRIISEVRELAQQNSVECINLLMEIARGSHNKESARVTAIREILDRALGKPVQAHEVGGPGGTPLVDFSSLSTDDLRLLAAIAAKASKSDKD